MSDATSDPIVPAGTVPLATFFPLVEAAFAARGDEEITRTVTVDVTADGDAGGVNLFPADWADELQDLRVPMGIVHVTSWGHAVWLLLQMFHHELRLVADRHETDEEVEDGIQTMRRHGEAPRAYRAFPGFPPATVGPVWRLGGGRWALIGASCLPISSTREFLSHLRERFDQRSEDGYSEPNCYLTGHLRAHTDDVWPSDCVQAEFTRLGLGDPHPRAVLPLVPQEGSSGDSVRGGILYAEAQALRLVLRSDTGAYATLAAEVFAVLPAVYVPPGPAGITDVTIDALREGARRGAQWQAWCCSFAVMEYLKGNPDVGDGVRLHDHPSFLGKTGAGSGHMKYVQENLRWPYVSDGALEPIYRDWLRLQQFCLLPGGEHSGHFNRPAPVPRKLHRGSPLGALADYLDDLVDRELEERAENGARAYPY